MQCKNAPKDAALLTNANPSIDVERQDPFTKGVHVDRECCTFMPVPCKYDPLLLFSDVHHRSVVVDFKALK
jgi:hypothetical protein